MISKPEPAKKRRKPITKTLITLRLDPEIIEHFRKDGRGWHTRINEALKRAVARAR